MPYAMDEKDLPLTLPDSNNFKPSGNGEGPLANLTDWINFSPSAKRDSNTMPTHAGAAWYFLRYMDPHNTKEFASKEALDYWNQVDVYIGGSEHAVAHLLYSRLWTKVLHDLGYLKFDEPFKKLINQGKITGNSKFIFRIDSPANIIINSDTKTKTQKVTKKVVYVSKKYYDSNPKTSEVGFNELQSEIIKQLGSNLLGHDSMKALQINKIRVPINFVDGDTLKIDEFKNKTLEKDEEQLFILEDGKYVCDTEVEKMSKSYGNVVNPDSVVEDYGADTLRMYEMFLGPLEASKPWSTSGIDGVFKFLRRFWTLFHDSTGNLNVSDEAPTKEELKVLHGTLKKVEQDIENYSFNTSVSAFMICANELSSLKCNKRAILEPLTIALSPFAPHITEELWSLLGHQDSIINATFPKYDEQYLKESSFEYPISINGKVRAKMNFALDMPKEDIEKIVLASEIVIKWSEGKAPKKIIVVPGRIVNVVL
jgi:leucyl-tRNA synthetase